MGAWEGRDPVFGGMSPTIWYVPVLVGVGLRLDSRNRYTGVVLVIDSFVPQARDMI